MRDPVLIGYENVERAGYAMREAAGEMARAAATIDSALFQHRQFLDEWLRRLEQIMTTPPPGQGDSHGDQANEGGKAPATQA